MQVDDEFKRLGLNRLLILFRDGTVRIWSCGKGKCLEPAISIDDVANCCDIVKCEESAYSITSPAGDDNIGKKIDGRRIKASAL